MIKNSTYKVPLRESKQVGIWQEYYMEAAFEFHAEK